jgi:hypothetical protein
MFCRFTVESRDLPMKPQPFYRSLVCCAVLAAAAVWPAQAQAQEDSIYRCAHNEYTNQVKGRTDCKRVEGGNVTIMHGDKPPAPVSSDSAGLTSVPQL